MVIYESMEVVTLANCSFTMNLVTGEQYVKVDLMIMLEMLRVDN